MFPAPVAPMNVWVPTQNIDIFVIRLKNGNEAEALQAIQTLVQLYNTAYYDRLTIFNILKDAAKRHQNNAVCAAGVRSFGALAPLLSIEQKIEVLHMLSEGIYDVSEVEQAILNTFTVIFETQPFDLFITAISLANDSEGITFYIHIIQLIERHLELLMTHESYRNLLVESLLQGLESDPYEDEVLSRVLFQIFQRYPSHSLVTERLVTILEKALDEAASHQSDEQQMHNLKQAKGFLVNDALIPKLAELALEFLLSYPSGVAFSRTVQMISERKNYIWIWMTGEVLRFCPQYSNIHQFTQIAVRLIQIAHASDDWRAVAYSKDALRHITPLVQSHLSGMFDHLTRALQRQNGIVG
jgi:hypothetical protein